MPDGIRLLVCGGRDYTDREAVFAALDRVHARCGVDLVIAGAARGVDRLAAAWARSRGVPLEEYPADWTRYRKAAGSLRNQLMLEEGRPMAVVAFPGGPGTADMCRRAAAALLPVWRPYR